MTERRIVHHTDDAAGLLNELDDALYGASVASMTRTRALRDQLETEMRIASESTAHPSGRAPVTHPQGGDHGAAARVILNAIQHPADCHPDTDPALEYQRALVYATLDVAAAVREGVREIVWGGADVETRAVADESTPATADEAALQVANAVYGATRLLEDLEHAGRVHGNGHHMRQEIADQAARLLRSRWIAADA